MLTRDIESFAREYGFEVDASMYVNAQSQIKFTCANGHVSFKRGNDFKARPFCKICNRIDRTAKFAEQVYEEIESHGFEVLERDYTKNVCNLHMKCPKGHEFKKTWNNFKKSFRCSVCSADSMGEQVRLSFDLVKSTIEKMGFELLEEKYINNITPMKMRCAKGHTFYSTLSRMKYVPRCKVCDPTRISKSMFQEAASMRGFTFIKKASDYKGTRVVLQCVEGHVFTTNWGNFKNGSGCPICNPTLYRGEIAIEEVMTHLGVNFDREYSFDGCRNIQPLPFDFVLLDDKKCIGLIEYDGKQHYEPIQFFGGKEALKSRQKRDEIKNTYCEEHDIPLLRIPYYQFENIPAIVEEFVGRFPI